MKTRIRALVGLLLAVATISLVHGAAADATGGCWPRVDRQTYEISFVC